VGIQGWRAGAAAVRRGRDGGGGHAWKDTGSASSRAPAVARCCSSSFSERKVALLHSVGYNSRIFSGDFLEHLSNNFDD
jgi:hypothetical protein